MSVNTRRVRGRRRLRFRSFDEARADIEHLRDHPYRRLGNWNLAQIVMHLGQVMHGSIDGAREPVQFPLPARILGWLFLRPYSLHVGIPAGIRLPPSATLEFMFDEAELNAAIDRYVTGAERLVRESKRAVHPLIGTLTPEQWNKFHLRHCEHHLSFLIPE